MNEPLRRGPPHRDVPPGGFHIPLRLPVGVAARLDAPGYAPPYSRAEVAWVASLPPTEFGSLEAARMVYQQLARYGLLALVPSAYRQEVLGG